SCCWRCQRGAAARNLVRFLLPNRQPITIINHRLDVMHWRVQPVKLLLILLAVLVFTTDIAEARKRHGGHHRRHHRVVYIDPTPRRDRDAAIVIDASTGNVLYERYADEQRFPASLTKMMTLYMLFEALQKGNASLST